MLSYFVIGAVALTVAALTLFSGFGLGTLLMPAFALFFPLEVAIAATAVVHLANNLFKLVLLARHADGGVVLRFGVPAAIMAILGAVLLTVIGEIPPVYEYALGSRQFRITSVGLTIAALMIAFAVVELHPAFEKLAFDRKWLPLGGVLSGFFGGLSGHQGALRSAFLVRSGLTREAFVGSNAVCSVIVDLSRLLVYGLAFFARDFATLREHDGLTLIAVGSLCAFIGSYVGTRLIKKVTLRNLQTLIGVMLIALAIGVGSGVVGK